MAIATTEAEQPWHAKFPAPSVTAEIFPQRRALMVLSMKISSMLIVDVRRTDYEGGAIRGSLNIPAQGFYWNVGMLYELAFKADIEWVIFTCNSCKDGNSRGARCASWFLDHVRNVAGDNDMQVLRLEGGIKGWVKAGPQYTQFMDGFDKRHWEQTLGEPIEDKPILNPPGSGSYVSPEEANLIRDAEADSAQKPQDEAPQEKKWTWDPSMLDP